MPRGRRKAEAEIGARSRKLDPQLRQARRKFDRFGKGARRDLQRSFRGIRADFGRLTALVGAGLFVQAGRDAVRFEDRLHQVGVQANASNREIDRFRDSVLRISRATGIAREEVLAGADEFVNLAGKVGFSEKVLETFARVARASGSETRDLANVALVLNRNFGITNAELEDAFSIMLAIGKEASVPLKQLGPQMRTVAAQFNEFGLSGKKGLADLTAAVQVIAPEFKGPEEAATGLNSLMTALAKNAGKLKKSGVKVFEKGPGGVKQFRNLGDIIDDIGNSKLAKDPSKLIKALGRNEARRAFSALRNNREEWQRLAAAGEKGTKTVAEDFGRRMQSSSVKVAKALNDAKLNMAKAFTPERIQKVAKLLERVAEAVEVMVDNLPLIAKTFVGLKVAGGLGALLDFAAAGGLKGALAGGEGTEIKTGRIRATSLLTGAVVAGAIIEKALDAAGDQKVREADAQANFATARDRIRAGSRGAFVASETRRGGVNLGGKLDQKKLNAAIGLTTGQGQILDKLGSGAGTIEKLKIISAGLTAQARQQGRVQVDIKVSDDRVTVRKKDQDERRGN